jgi:hypothetical protein
MLGRKDGWIGTESGCGLKTQNLNHDADTKYLG